MEDSKGDDEGISGTNGDLVLGVKAVVDIGLRETGSGLCLGGNLVKPLFMGESGD